MPPKQTCLRRQQMHGEGDDSGSVLRFLFTGTFAIRRKTRKKTLLLIDLYQSGRHSLQSDVRQHV